MHFSTPALSVLLLGLGISACDAAANPLIGKWQATHGDMSSLTHTNYCVIDHLEFTARAETLHTIAVAGGKAYFNTVPVTYGLDAAPKMAVTYVNGDNTRGTAYTLLDPNTIRMEDSNRCIYKRAG